MRIVTLLVTILVWFLRFLLAFFVPVNPTPPVRLIRTIMSISDSTELRIRLRL